MILVATGCVACSSSGGTPPAPVKPYPYKPPAVGTTLTFERHVDDIAEPSRTERIASITASGADRIATIDITTGSARSVQRETLYPNGSVSAPLDSGAGGLALHAAKPILFPTPTVLATGEPYTQQNSLIVGTGANREIDPMTIETSANGTTRKTVPAGTYTVQEIDVVATIDLHDGTTDSITEKEYRASGVGIVEVVETDDAEGISGTVGHTVVEMSSHTYVDKLVRVTHQTNVA